MEVPTEEEEEKLRLVHVVACFDGLISETGDNYSSSSPSIDQCAELTRGGEELQRWCPPHKRYYYNNKPRDYGKDLLSPPP